MPQAGYYDTAEAFDKTAGKKTPNAVRMELDLPRKDLFSGVQTSEMADAFQLAKSVEMPSML